MFTWNKTQEKTGEAAYGNPQEYLKRTSENVEYKVTCMSGEVSTIRADLSMIFG